MRAALRPILSTLRAGTVGLALGVPALAVGGGAVAGAATGRPGAPFSVHSAALSDDAVVPRLYTGDLNGCTGRNRSPPLAWRNAPSDTRSFAIVLFDVDGNWGLGFTHWIVYGIPARVTALPAGAGADSARTFIRGRNSRGSLEYAGPCPRPGDAYHHYVFMVYALDLAPRELAPGLDRAALDSVIKGHILAAASLVGRRERR